MGFTPKDWHNEPTEDTPMNAAALMDMETRLAGYAERLRSAAVNVLDYGAKGDGTTNDTAAVQSAINAAIALSTAGGITTVLFPAGYAFKLRQLTIGSGVCLWAYGATVLVDTTSMSQALLWGNNIAMNRFETRGGTWTGANTVGEGTFDIFRNGVDDMAASCTDVLFEHMLVRDWGGGVIRMQNPQRAQALNNVFLNVGQHTTYNAVNFVVDGTAAASTQDMVAAGNIIHMGTFTGTNGGAAICYVNIHNTGTTDVRCQITDNICSGTASGSGSASQLAGSINIEFDGAGGGPWKRFLVAGNIVEVAGSGTLYGIGSDADYARRVIIAHNDVTCTSRGIGYVGNDHDVSHNRIDAPTPILGTPSLQTGNRLSDGLSQGQVALAGADQTITTAEVQSGDNILLASRGATTGDLYVGTITAGTSFVIENPANDNCTVYWRIDH